MELKTFAFLVLVSLFFSYKVGNYQYFIIISFIKTRIITNSPKINYRCIIVKFLIFRKL